MCIRNKMGGIKSKPELPQEDLDFLRAHTCYDEDTIKEWYRGFRSDCPDGRLTPKAGFIFVRTIFIQNGKCSPFLQLTPPL